MDINEAIREAVIKSFSEMAFIDVTATAIENKDIKYSQIFNTSFLYPQSGDLYLFLSYECKKSIVENIYGKDWSSLDQNTVDDCLLELLNVISGNFMILYYSNKTKYNMSLPKLIFDDSEIIHGRRLLSFYFNAEGKAFKVAIYIRDKNS